MRIQQGQGQHAAARTAALAMPQVQFNEKLLAMTAFSLAIAIASLWSAYLPTISGAVWSTPSISSQRAPAESYTVNHADKGDRLAVVIRFSDRWSPVETISKNKNANPRTSRVPEGCEFAFSRLVKAGNFSTRCVASVSSSVMPA